jgi:L-alanine-DL-glutamate epimerase-like enolase superfamily enzyme/CMP-N-acetylneuraminic acid synthetase
LTNPKLVALVPARSGSERVPGKNIRPLGGHPLLAYAIETALQSGVFERVVVSTDSEAIAEVACWYGADVPFLRPAEFATSTSPDIEWLAYTVERLPEEYDAFAIVRATNPFRGPDVVRRGLEQLLATPEADSLRAVELVKQHPGKMWEVEEGARTMRPLLDQSHLESAWHEGQYPALPAVYVQNSALEIAWTRVLASGTKEGSVVAPFLTQGHEGLNIDDEEDWQRAEHLLAAGVASLPEVGRPPFPGDAAMPSGTVRPSAARGARVASLETLYCDAGWRPWIFVKATTEDGLVGWAEITDSHGSPRGLAGIVEDLAPLVLGRDPRATEEIYWRLYRSTRQSPGSVIAKAIGGIENALLDLKGKLLDVPVYELFGGPTRETIPLYWSHCGTTRARAWEVTETPKLASYEDVAALGREVVERGFDAFKTNVVVPGDEPQVLMPGFGEGDGTIRAGEIAAALSRLLEAFAEGTEGKARPIVDLNFSLEPEGCLHVANALRDFGLLFLEVDLFEPAALALVRQRTSIPVCSGENLYGNRDFRPFLEAGAMDVASVDVIWNGFHQAKKIADLAETFEVNCAPHNYYSHLATFISAQWCAAIPNARILEIDVDDVPWRDELVTATPAIAGGEIRVPSGPGWGVELVEDVLREHPWPRG